MPSLTIENYVKAIYQLAGEDESDSVSTGALATQLGVSPSSVTSMLKTLHDSELAEHRPYVGVRLTDQGRRLALRVLRRHRLIELFLARTLKLTWDEVHEEAEHMEHAVSDLLVDRIDEYLGFPGIDPHGDPIPKSDGSVAVAAQTALSACSAGCEFRVQRVLDQTAEFLRFLSESSLEIGARGTVLRCDTSSGTITIRVNAAEMTLSKEAAGQIMIATVFGMQSASVTD